MEKRKETIKKKGIIETKGNRKRREETPCNICIPQGNAKKKIKVTT